MKRLIALSAIMAILLVCSGTASAFLDNNSSNTTTTTSQNEANAHADNNSSPTFNGLNIEAAEPMRGFANPGSVTYGPAPAFFGPDTPGPTYQGVELILPLKSEWQRYELEPTVEDTDIMFRCRYFIKSGRPDQSSYDKISVITAPPQGAYKMIGHITLWSQDNYTTSFELMAKAGLLALDLPTAGAILITGQGCEKKVETEGWGLGFNSTAATVSGNQDVGTVHSGGTGYSSGTAGNVGRPWLQVAVIQYAQ